jgi:hypothetical protein
MVQKSLLHAAPGLGVGSGLLGPQRRVVCLVDRGGAFSFTPDLAEVLDEAACRQPRSHLAILTRLLLEQLRGQLAAHGHSTSSLGALCVHLARRVATLLHERGDSGGSGGGRRVSDDEFESDRLWCSDIAEALHEAARLCAAVCEAIAIPTASLVSPNPHNVVCPTPGAASPAPVSTADTLLLRQDFLSLDRGEVGLANEAGGGSIAAGGMMAQSPADHRSSADEFDEEFGWFFNDENEAKAHAPPSSPQDSAAAAADSDASRAGSTATDPSTPVGLLSIVAPSPSAQESASSPGDLQVYQSHLVQRLCMGLQHRIPEEWILLESLDTGEIHECRSQGEKQQPLSESGGRWVKGGGGGGSDDNNHDSGSDKFDNEAYDDIALLAGDESLVLPARLAMDAVRAVMQRQPSRHCCSNSDSSSELYDDDEDYEDEEAYAHTFGDEDDENFWNFDSAEDQSDCWYDLDLERIVVSKAVGPNPARSRLLGSSVLLPVPPPAESNLRDALRGGNRCCIGLVRGDCDEGEVGEGSGASEAALTEIGEAKVIFSATDFVGGGATYLEECRERWCRYAIETLRSAGVSFLAVTGSVSPALLHACAASVSPTTSLPPHYHTGPIAVLPHCPVRLVNALALATGATPLHDVLEMEAGSTTSAAIPVNDVSTSRRATAHLRFLDGYTADSFTGWTPEGEGIYILPERDGDGGSPSAASPDVHVLVTMLPPSGSVSGCEEAQRSGAPEQSQDDEIDNSVEIMGVVLCGPTAGVVEEMEYAFWRTAHRLKSALNDISVSRVQSPSLSRIVTAPPLPPGKVLPGGGFVEVVCAEMLRWYEKRLAAQASSIIEHRTRPGKDNTAPPLQSSSSNESSFFDNEEDYEEERYFERDIARCQAISAFADALDYGYILQGLSNQGFSVQQSLARLDMCRSALRAVLPDDTGSGDTDDVGATKLNSAAVRRRLDAVARVCDNKIASSSAPLGADPGADPPGASTHSGKFAWDCFGAKVDCFERAASFVAVALCTDEILSA